MFWPPGPADSLKASALGFTALPLNNRADGPPSSNTVRNDSSSRTAPTQAHTADYPQLHDSSSAWPLTPSEATLSLSDPTPSQTMPSQPNDRVI